MPNLLAGLQGLGQAKPVSEFINTAGQYQTQQNQNRLQRMQIQQLEKDNTEYDPNAVLNLWDEHKRPHILEAWKSAGVINPETGMIRGADVRNTQKYILDNQKVSEALMTSEYEQLARKVASAGKKTDPKSQQEALDAVAQMTAIEKARRLGKDKTTTLVPKGTQGTLDSEGKFTKLPGVGEDLSSVDLGTPLGTAESGAEVYHTTMGNVAVDPNTNERMLYDQQAHGTYSKKDEDAQKTPITDFGTFYDAGTAKGWDADKISKEWHDLKMKEAIASSKVRGEGFAASRPVQVLDTKNGNAPAIMSLADVTGANSLEPGRYIPMGSQKALGQTALIEDIRGAIVNTRQSLSNLKNDFTAAQAAQIALVMKQRDPRSATSAFIGSRIGETLSPDQIDYVTDLAQLIENGMAMRSVLGAGQGSDELRSAIMNTIPSAKTPNRAYANTQLDKFEQQINRLERGVPKVKLRTDTGKTQTGTGPTVVEKRTLPNGETWEKLSDGTFREAQ